MIPGETGAALTVTPADAGTSRFRLEVIDACDNATSRDFEVVVHAPPQVTPSVPRVEACPGETRELAATVASTLPVTVQWYRDGKAIDEGIRVPGATNQVLTIGDTQVSDAGRYRLRASCDCGETWTLPAVVTLDPQLPIFLGSETTTLVWPDTGAVLEMADDARGPWLAVPGASSPFQPSTVGVARFYRLRLL